MMSKARKKITDSTSPTATSVPLPPSVLTTPTFIAETDLLERMLTANEKPLVIFQQLVKEGRNPVFMLRYAGKGTRPSDRDGPTISRTTSREEDPTTPKSAVPMSAPPGDAYGRYA